ncbi:MAG: hypothetical protein HKL86_01150 [Acidimicrobiaceae bacterium]|nr:hypothetical protein [Acidimicrobiaceae bacterium]
MDYFGADPTLARSTTAGAFANITIVEQLAVAISGAIKEAGSLVESEATPLGHSPLGAAVGSLMLYTSPDFLGDEITLVPDDRDAPRSTGLVLERNLVSGVSFAAIFPTLRRGTYTIEGSDQRVSIAGGRVTTLEYHDGCCRIYHHPSPMSALVDGGGAGE